MMITDIYIIYLGPNSNEQVTTIFIYLVIGDYLALSCVVES